MHFPVIAFFTSHVKIAFAGIVVKIADSLSGIPVQFNIKGNVLVKGVGFLRVVAHSVLGAHAHEFLRFIEVTAFFAKSIEAVLGGDFAGMNTAAVGVFLVGQIHNIGMKQSIVLIIYADAEWGFFDNYGQFFSADDCFFFSVLQNCVSRLDPLSVIFQKTIHAIFPCSHNKTVGFFCKISFKTGPDPQNGICQKQQADFHTVGCDGKAGALFCYGKCSSANFHFVNLLGKSFEVDVPVL